MVGPAADAPILSSAQAPAIPPVYSSSCSTSKSIAPPYTSLSSSVLNPTPSQIIANIFDIMPSQIRWDLAELSETEPETEDEGDHIMVCYLSHRWTKAYNTLQIKDAICITKVHMLSYISWPSHWQLKYRESVRTQRSRLNRSMQRSPDDWRMKWHHVNAFEIIGCYIWLWGMRGQEEHNGELLSAWQPARIRL